MEQSFNKVIDLLYLAKQDGVEVFLNEERLQLKVADNKYINENLLKEIRNNKQLIIEYLASDNWKVKTFSKTNRITRFNRNSTPHIPLSFSQERLWFIDQLEGSVQYHSPIVLRLLGNLDNNALLYSIRTLIQRHESLRTVFYEEAGHVYQSVKESNDWDIEIVEGAEYKDDEEALKLFIEKLFKKPFDLSGDYPIRGSLIRVGEKEHILVVTMHHIASDAWSISIIVKEVVELYSSYVEGREVKLSSLPLQYADYAIWQQEYLRGPVLDKKLDYWKHKLQGQTPLQLPTDYSRPVIKGIKGASLTFGLDKELAARLRELSHRQGASLFMVLLSTFKVLLYRYSGQQDISVGTSIASRQQKELEGLVGFFVNTLALRDEVNGSGSFVELLQQVKLTTLEAYEHQDLPFEKVVEAVVKERDAGINPLFQVMLVLANTPEASRLQLGEVQLSGLPVTTNISKFDITFFVSETSTGLNITVEYNTDLYKGETIRRMAGHYEVLLGSVVRDPGQRVGLLPMLTLVEERQLLDEFGRSEVWYPSGKSVVDLFEEQVVRAPGATAVVFEGQRLTYRELNEGANRLAHALVQRGVKAGSLVGLCVERSASMLTGIMGILKSGAGYVPFDTDFPLERMSYMIADSGVGVMVVSGGGMAGGFEGLAGLQVIEVDGAGGYSEENLSVKPMSDDLAYVIYTSGSTGRPKGVMIEHGSLVDYYYGLNRRVGVGDCGSFGLVSSLSTDLGNTVIYSSLLSGGALHVFSRESASDAGYLRSYFSQQRVGCLKIVPSHWRALSRQGELLLPELLLVLGGESLPGEIVEEIRVSGAGCRVVNHYGPTETTIGKLLHEVGQGECYEKTVPVGRPFGNTRVYVLSGERQLSPVGVAGQLYIGGRGMSRGYCNNELLTREKFVTDPFSQGEPGGVMYGTGDQVKWLSDGSILFIGRVDNQVKIRGYRVEPGEVEAVLEESVLVSQAVVVAQADLRGDQRLVAYIVAGGGGEFDREGIMSHAHERLPGYMLPGVLVAVEELPLTANGKVDRKALPDPEGCTVVSASKYVGVRNETESRLAEIWQSVLEVEVVGMEDDFFGLGGHSLLAVRLISAIRKAFGVEMPISDIFDYPTIFQLSGRLTGPVSVAAALPGIARSEPRPERVPLSFSQERLWFIDRLSGSLPYHVPSVLRLRGMLDKEVLSGALRGLIDRHEVLRTVIAEQEGTGYQVTGGSGKWQLEDMDGRRYEHDEQGLGGYIQQLIEAPFDLSSDYMLRATLIRLGEWDHVLVATLHHIACDGYSTAIMVRELTELYNAAVEHRVVQLPPLRVQYVDYALWQRSYLQGEVLEEKLGYWKEKLQGVSALQIPTDYARPLVQSSRGGVSAMRIDKELSVQLQLLSRREGVTMFMTVLAAFKVLLYRYSGQQDICVGTPIAGRQQQELEGLIGFFVNTLALRSQVSGEGSFRELLQQVKATTLQAYEHQDVPFEKVVEAVVKERDLSRSPLFQVMLALHNTPQTGELRLGEVQLSQEGYGSASHHTSKFELTFNITETVQGLYVSVEYCTDLFSESTIEKMAVHYRNLLSSIVQYPDQSIGTLPMLTQGELHQLLQSFNDTDAAYPLDKTLTGLFEEQVAKTPESTALIFGNIQLSYRQLNERSNKFAHYLISKEVKPGSLVPICMERSMEMVIGLLGILKTGAAYVPIDADHPIERIRYILDDTKATIVVTNTGFASSFAATESFELICVDNYVTTNMSSTNLPDNVSNDHLVCVIYTSGSSGKPKGVKLGNGGIMNRLHWMWATYPYKPDERNAIKTSIGFGDHIWELFGALNQGIPSVIFSKEELLDLDHLAKKLHSERITRWVLVPSLLKMLLNKLEDNSISLPYLKYWTSSGETLPVDMVYDFYKVLPSPSHKLLNIYGSCEVSADVSCYDTCVHDWNNNEGKPYKNIPIGKPIANTKLYIVDKNEQLVAEGVMGEICIGGMPVGQGYLNLAELTSERFASDPFIGKPGLKMFKSGDYGRWLPDGNMEYLGRIDDQVKIRGNRVELGEIESVLTQGGIVDQCVVLVKKDKSGNNNLISYVVAKKSFDKQAASAWLKNKLPDYMIPSVWVTLESLPLTPNGKIDKKALADHNIRDLFISAYTGPRNTLEAKLLDIWKRLLPVERIDIFDNFFELGGHSLLAMRLVSAIRKELEIDVTIRNLFSFYTIASLATHLETKDVMAPVPAIEVLARPEYIPLSFSQERLWFIDQLGGSLQYHNTAVLRLKGTLNEIALEAALLQIIIRHEVLRTVILENEGTGYQFIKEIDGWQLKISDGSDFIGNIDGLEQYILQSFEVPFNFSKDYMLRAELIRVEEQDQVLVLIIHHIAYDGWSASIIVKELMEFYNACLEKRDDSLFPLPIQYADYAIWQRKYLQGSAWDKKLGYWKDKLDGVPVLKLPADYSRPLIQSTKGAMSSSKIEKELLDQLHSLSQQQGATLFMTLLTAFNVLLHRYSGQRDICIGTPVAGRQQQELEGLIGFFVNTLALRNEVIGIESFTDLLQKVRDTTLESYEHQEVPFEKVVELVVKERDISRSPLFQVMFVLQNTPEINELKLGEMQLSGGLTGSTHSTSKFDLSFLIRETDQGLHLTVEYCTDLYNEHTVRRMMGHFNELLISVIQNPGQSIGLLPMLTHTERHQLLVDFNKTAVSYPADKTIVDLFEEQVANHPENIALVFNEERLTYREINKRSNQLAHYLHKRGVVEGMMVPVLIERSTEMLIGILAILKSGGVYVPIDPHYPIERINFMLEDTGPKIILTSPESFKKLQDYNGIDIIEISRDGGCISKEPVENLKVNILPANLAYVIYTSGSTGKPKGVMVTHNNVVSLVKEVDYVSLTGNDILLSTGSISFDATTFEYWGMLLNGGQLVLCTESKLLDNNLLKSEINKANVNLMWFTSSWFNQLVEVDITLFEKLNTILVGGEKLSEHHIEKVRQAYPGIKIINGYGPTENTTFSLTYDVLETEIKSPVPIGRPLNNRTAFILDENRQIVPIGVSGEIYLGGDGLSRGYLNRPDLTISEFVPSPFSDASKAMIYKTGDLGRWRLDGNIEYLGRKDSQVKIRGYRIELEEIETVLQQSGLVSQSVVVVNEDERGITRLIAYFVPMAGVDKEMIHDYLLTMLPVYMVPSLWVKLEKLPLTSNGKVDKGALPPFNGLEQLKNEFVAPVTEFEKALVEVWRVVLNVPIVGIHDNFFELGGDSLLTIQVVSRTKKMGYELLASDLFIHQTIARLSVALERRSREVILTEHGGEENTYQEMKSILATTSKKDMAASSSVANKKYLVPIKTTGAKKPLYIIAGGGGTANKFMRFAKMLDADQPVYALQAPIDSSDLKEFPSTIEKIAATFIEEIVSENPNGPYALSGHCTGGLIAFEMAKQLKASGKKIHMLAVFDTIIGKKKEKELPNIKNYYNIPLYVNNAISKTILKFDFEMFLLRKYTRKSIGYKIDSFKSLIKKFKKLDYEDDKEQVGWEIFAEASGVYQEAQNKYEIIPYEGELLIFYAKERYYFTDSSNNIRYKKIFLDDNLKKRWKQFATSIIIYDVEGDHSNMFENWWGEKFALQLQKHLDNAENNFEEHLLTSNLRR